MNMPTEVANRPKRRLLVVNPNSNQEVTERVQASVDSALDSDIEAVVIHSPESPHSIETLADRNKAEPHAIALLGAHQHYDAYVMACFDDIAIKAARRFLDVPVVDAVEASVAIARLYGTPFSIVTTVEAMVPGIRSLIETLGVSKECTVRAAGIGVASAAAGEPESLLKLDEAIVRARDVDGAKAIILGSGGLTGQAVRLSKKHGLTVIDCIEAAVMMASVSSRIKHNTEIRLAARYLE